MATQRGHYHTLSITNRKFLFFVHVRRALRRIKNAKTHRLRRRRRRCQSALPPAWQRAATIYETKPHTRREALTAVTLSGSHCFYFHCTRAPPLSPCWITASAQLATFNCWVRVAWSTAEYLIKDSPNLPKYNNSSADMHVECGEGCFRQGAISVIWFVLSARTTRFISNYVQSMTHCACIRFESLHVRM